MEVVARRLLNMGEIRRVGKPNIAKINVKMPVVEFKKTGKFGFLMNVARKGGKGGAFGRALAEEGVEKGQAALALHLFYKGVWKEGSAEARKKFIVRELNAYAKAKKA
ncbi:MAG: hypothetical protein V1676_05400 [Candidatus Diapherotrites archaeon]